jgi:hypothetical protein
MTPAAKFTTLAVLLAAAGAASLAQAHEGGKRGLQQRFDFEAMDANSDESLSRTEIMTHTGERIDQFDANSDGRIDRDEVISGMSEHRGGKWAGKMGGRGEKRFDRMFERMGPNEDGEIVIEEFTGSMADRIIERLDTDGDGSISKAEADDMPKRWAGRKGGWGGHDRKPQN